MKKIITLILFGALLANCSSDTGKYYPSDSAGSVSFNFTLDNKVDFVKSIDHSSSWTHNPAIPPYKNEYVITSYVNPKGQKAFDSYSIWVNLIIETDGDLQQNKVYDISEIYFLGSDLPLTYSFDIGCNKTDLHMESGISTGQIKITSFDGNILKGVFFFDKLTNDDGSGFGDCDGAKIPKRSLSVTKGSFICNKS